MKTLLILLVLGLTQALPQLEFESEAPAEDEAAINTRLGLLANSLGVSPVGASSPSSGALTDGTASGRGAQQCCCVPVSEQCGDPLGRDDDLVGGGLIDPRLQPGGAPQISIRIVNNPVQQPNQAINGCPANQKTCCYDAEINLSVFGKTCISPEQANSAAQGLWRQSCGERISTGGKQCGTRQFVPAAGRTFGQSSPGEFPWTCLLLNQNNDFIGTCAIIPSTFDNNNGVATRKVLTAAHKLSKVGQTDLLKVRVGEYDASGFNPPETVQHQEYTVVRILKHPKFNPKRLDNNLAILTLDRPVDLSLPTVNTACLPSCDDQFDFRFNNGTGSRCWVAGWGKNQENGEFQFIQRKVDIPLFERNQCNLRLKAAMNQRKAGLGNTFNLDLSEICAGGETGKDACTGDGGSPLVCQAQSGRWTVVGLVTWGVGCASEVPGVYARISYFRDWINAN